MSLINEDCNSYSQFQHFYFHIDKNQNMVESPEIEIGVGEGMMLKLLIVIHFAEFLRMETKNWY